jgi:hypothetical protein
LPAPRTRIASGEACPGSNDASGTAARSVAIQASRAEASATGSPDASRRSAIAGERARSLDAQRSLERVAEPRRGRRDDRLFEERRVAPVAFAVGAGGAAGVDVAGGRRLSTRLARLRRGLAEDGVGEGGDARASRLGHGLHGLVHRGERGDAHEEELVGREQQVGAHPGVELSRPAGSEALELRLEPRCHPQRAVDELRREAPIAGLELRGARELGLERRGREGVLLLDADEHARRQIPGALHRLARVTTSAPAPA